MVSFLLSSVLIELFHYCIFNKACSGDVIVDFINFTASVSVTFLITVTLMASKSNDLFVSFKAIPPTNIGKEEKLVLILLIKFLAVRRCSVKVIEIRITSGRISFNELMTEYAGNEGEAL